MIRKLFAVAFVLPLMSLQAQSVLTGGRSGADGFETLIHGGVGRLRDVKGSVDEREGESTLPGGLQVDLGDLGVKEDGEAIFVGARIQNAWVAFLLDYRRSNLKGTGTSEQEFRFSVDSIVFAGQDLDYLVIPVDTSYRIDAEAQWLGLGFRVTPLTFNPDGFVRFTPWVHLGLQYIRFEYDIDAGAVAGVEFDGRTERLYARQGRGISRERAAIPEYGLGGEIRMDLGPGGTELVFEATMKWLDFQGALGRLGVDGDDFKDIDFTYKALEMNLYGQFQLNDRLDLLAGVFMERVEMDYQLDGDRLFDGIQRDVGLEYTIYGLRFGLLF